MTITRLSLIDDFTDPTLPEFPVASLAEWLGEFVAAVAEETQTPVDCPGIFALAVLAACAGDRVEVRPWGN
jgi:hypothetical protein